MATAVEKIENELIGLMGETGRSVLHASYKRTHGRHIEDAGHLENIEFFNKVALVQDLANAFAMLMTEEQIIRFKLKLLNLKGDEEQ